MGEIYKSLSVIKKNTKSFKEIDEVADREEQIAFEIEREVTNGIYNKPPKEFSTLHEKENYKSLPDDD